ncbi:hypothetical protein HMPREF1991_03107 [Hoylesella loescheii DSM 19665 = JCM 12249 = ATCC 15930]|uniref:Uncharacterized protein n=1 Tax=Hoylesella loescheii DSM 19665 = JCM 12249 = ATCC 15930 TaxID=1122985 RepID=A0A069QLZ2_HOYLO|nr:hypothetical protein HMPREF1991_03107 [Hoylesella loescheii DSM 19665 = JCM 12249 = ATCC 15930]
MKCLKNKGVRSNGGGVKELSGKSNKVYQKTQINTKELRP